ncbi:MAG: Fic family protein [Deltaproteobacteria bacterium]|nr:Fic family protein [Deltaproteobacteria bacterium]
MPVHIAWLMGQCMEAKGKQELWLHGQPELMNNLKTLAKIQSVESSNRIEGVITSRDRLAPLIAGKITPHSRPEEEILGYKKALEWICQNYQAIDIDKNSILFLHKLIQSGQPGESYNLNLFGSPVDAGQIKTKDNEIIELLPSGERIVRFEPVSAEQTPFYLQQLCLAFKDETQKQSVPQLLLISSFVFDFLCIHPFRDGNGRISRLLTLLLLYQAGYLVGALVSLERLIEINKEAYYLALKKSSDNWHVNKHDINHWHQFFLGTIKEAFRELSEQVAMNQPHQGKRDLIRYIVKQFNSAFTLSQLKSKAPNVSESMIRKVLQEMKKEGLLVSEGKGRSAKWKNSI